MKELKLSEVADHRYYLESKEKRAVCTPGTRERILANITAWARDSSSESQTIYWLFGMAGTGKSTIAFTLARRFELAGNTDTTALGGNFFCSRQFDETKEAKRIVRTIVYHLALVCKPFAIALIRCGRFNAIHRDVRTQLEDLLVTPWGESESGRLADPFTPPNYLIVIDALDEIDGKGGSHFLRDLLNIINKHHLLGLKFFVTSRPDPYLVIHLRSFEDKQFYRLEDVPFEEGQNDIAEYLNMSLPNFVGRPEMDRLVSQADGLFIYAAAIVKYLADHEEVEQRKLLDQLLASSALGIPQTEEDEVSLLDQLYLQLLSNAFRDMHPALRPDRLKILHTFLCTAERTSTSIVANLVFASDADSVTKLVDTVLAQLHGVLYTQNGKVFWYHKSFPDFLFNPDRSKEFWCNEAEHHRRLMESCFRIMKSGLRFNIANIPPSFVLDSDNSMLSDAVKQNIPPFLSYSCRNWDYHLCAVETRDMAPLCETLSEFLKLPLLFWMEAMNLLGFSGLCDPMLQNACKWVMEVSLSLAKEFMINLPYGIVRLSSGRTIGRGGNICCLLQREQSLIVDTSPVHISTSNMAAECRALSGMEEPFSRDSPLDQCLTTWHIGDDYCVAKGGTGRRIFA